MSVVYFVHRPAAIEPQQAMIHMQLPHTKETRGPVNIAAVHPTTGQVGPLGVFMSRPESEQWSDAERKINMAVLLRLHRWEMKQSRSGASADAGSVTSADEHSTSDASATPTTGKRKAAPASKSPSDSASKRPRAAAPVDSASEPDDDDEEATGASGEDESDDDGEQAGRDDEDDSETPADKDKEMKQAARAFPVARFGPAPEAGTAAREVWQKAIKGDKDAQWVLGAMYYDLDWNTLPEHELKRSFKFAAAWLEKAANAGETDAIWLLGLMHATGEAPKSSPQLARRLLARAANASHIEALIDYGDQLLDVLEERGGKSKEAGGFDLISNSFSAYCRAFWESGKSNSEAAQKARQLRDKFPERKLSSDIFQHGRAATRYHFI